LEKNIEENDILEKSGEQIRGLVMN